MKDRLTLAYAAVMQFKVQHEQMLRGKRAWQAEISDEEDQLQHSLSDALEYLELLQEIADRAAVYYRDTIRQAAKLAIQDFENVNLLGLRLDLVTEIPRDTFRYPKEEA